MPRFRARLTILALLAMIFALVPAVVSAATESATINFEGLAEGATVTSLSLGSGISGDPIAGSVGVSASGGVGPAMIFDSNCSGASCSGNDPDLAGTTGKVLIVSQDGDTTDPNDNANGGTLSFDLSGFGPGTFTVVSLQITDYGDHSNPIGTVTVGGTTVTLPEAGNGVQQDVVLNLTGNSIVVDTNDSYSVDNIELEWTTPPENPGTGTQGYWKNHPDAWPVDDIWIGGIEYSKTDAIDLMKASGRGDKTYGMFEQLVAAKLNVLIGNDASCIAADIAAADTWMAAHPVGSGVKANSDAWKNSGSDLHGDLDDYNNGLLCAPHRG